MSAIFITGKTLRRKHRNYSHTSGAFTDEIPGHCIVTQPIHSGVKRDQLDVTCFIISLFNAQHVSDVNTSILRSLRLMC